VQGGTGIEMPDQVPGGWFGHQAVKKYFYTAKFEPF
jgi:hypothetical protein